MGKITAILEALFGMDIRAMALMRIGFSAIVLLDCIDHFPYVKDFYSNQGVFPDVNALQALKPGAWSLNFINGSWEFQMFLFGIMACASLSLLIGYRTRLCTFLLWVLLCSFHYRNWMILGAEDKLLHILFFWFLFLPWGSCYSVDSLRNQHRGIPLRVLSMGTAAYLLQICFFYCFAGLLKNAPTWTLSGTAVYTILSAKQFAKPFGLSLLNHPQLLKLLSFTAVAFERFGTLFLFIPWKITNVRIAVIAVFVFFHTSIMLCMELKYFQWICLITLIGFLPTPFLNIFLPVPRCVDGHAQTPAKSSWKPDLFDMPLYLKAFVGSMIIYVLIWNILDLRSKLNIMPPALKKIGYALSVRQHWGMYGPAPFIDDGWFVIPGKLHDGSTVDVFRKGAPVVWEEPASIIALNNNYAWTLYYMNAHDKDYSANLKPWAHYLCREWNETHGENQRLMALDIIYMERKIIPNGQAPIPRKRPLLSHSCAADSQ